MPIAKDYKPMAPTSQRISAKNTVQYEPIELELPPLRIGGITPTSSDSQTDSDTREPDSHPTGSRSALGSLSGIGFHVSTWFTGSLHIGNIGQRRRERILCSAPPSGEQMTWSFITRTGFLWATSTGTLHYSTISEDPNQFPHPLHRWQLPNAGAVAISSGTVIEEAGSTRVAFVSHSPTHPAAEYPANQVVDYRPCVYQLRLGDSGISVVNRYEGLSGVMTSSADWLCCLSYNGLPGLYAISTSKPGDRIRLCTASPESCATGIVTQNNQLVVSTNVAVEIYDLPPMAGVPAGVLLPKELEPSHIIRHPGTSWTCLPLDHTSFSSTLGLICYNEEEIRLYGIHANAEGICGLKRLGEIPSKGYITALAIGSTMANIYWLEHDIHLSWHPTASRIMTASLPVQPLSAAMEWKPTRRELWYDTPGGPLSHCDQLHVDEIARQLYVARGCSQIGFWKQGVPAPSAMTDSQTARYFFESEVRYGLAGVDRDSSTPTTEGRHSAVPFWRHNTMEGKRLHSTRRRGSSRGQAVVRMLPKDVSVKQIQQSPWLEWQENFKRWAAPSHSPTDTELVQWTPASYKAIPEWHKELIERVPTGLRFVLQTGFGIRNSVLFFAMHADGVRYLAVVPTENVLVFLLVSNYSNAEAKKDMYGLQVSRVEWGETLNITSLEGSNEFEFSLNENALQAMEAAADDEDILRDDHGAAEDQLGAASRLGCWITTNNCP
ncbi:hypothetical protein CALVIDRAFT_365338 [Calocera viscosa TUFC12733]|uniref:Uncharacterized protein n=1 Tax=Calocera viscosa (strain TUFC12733) TaxID=1330018 RepID=A0A167H2K6_CALVF|nr:hypothetical protein CALVIDRAFT_365338 [Calocera viscosa TUFC12733]